MNEEIKQENKQEDKKHFKHFIVIMACSCLAGVFMGVAATSSSLQSLLEELPDMLTTGLKTALPFLMAVFCILLPLISLGLYYSLKSTYREDMSDEEHERLDYNLSIPIIITSITNICSFACMGCLMTYLTDDIPPVPSMICVVMFIIHMVLVVIVQKNVVDLEKILNPEKNGSIFDTNFADVWEASCDEAEKLMIYKASYKAYRTGTKTCISLWTLCCLGSMFFDTGVLPIFMISIIWLSMTVSYHRTGMRLESARMQGKV